MTAPSQRARLTRLTVGVAVAMLSCHPRSGVAALAKRGLASAFAFEKAVAPPVSAPPEKVCEPVFPYLDGEPSDESLSVGDTSNGRVVHAKALGECDAVAILPKQKARDLAYGSSELVDMLEEAGATLFQETGTRLWIGNIGKRGGGDIPFSVSHNAGRDADVALSYLDAQGKPVDPPDLVPLGKDGWSSDHKLSLDAKRSWITVRALVTSKRGDVEYVFLSDPLRKKLLTWARDHGEKPSVVERAAEVLKQPAGAAPHDDHLHVRIYCGARDVGAGCVDTGTPRAPTAAEVATRNEKVKAALSALEAKSADTRARGTLRLALLGEARHLDSLRPLLDDPAPSVRHAVVSAFSHLGSDSDTKSFADRFLKETDPSVRERMVLAAAILGGESGGRLLRVAIETPDPPDGSEVMGPVPLPLVSTQATEPRPRPLGLSLSIDLLDGGSLASPLPRSARSVRAFAVAVAGRADRIEPIPALVALLGDGDATLREAAAESLALVTNHRFGDAWGDGSDATARASAKGRYEALWKKLGKSPRNAWVLAGFAAAGYKVRAVDKTSAWELVRATTAEPHLGYNARELLARIAEEPRADVTSPADEACAYYLRVFLDKRRFHLDKPPQTVVRACTVSKRI